MAKTFTFANSQDFVNQFNNIKGNEELEAIALLSGMRQLGYNESGLKILEIEKLPSDEIAKTTYYFRFTTDNNDEDASCEIMKLYNNKWFSENPSYDILISKVENLEGFDKEKFEEPEF